MSSRQLARQSGWHHLRMRPRTSLTDPLEIAEVTCAPWAEGVIGVTFCPGKQGPSVFGRPWARDIDMDVDVIKRWGCTLAITLIEEPEFAELGVRDLGTAFRARSIDWHHLPIQDLKAPTARFLEQWSQTGSKARDCLRAGEKVLVHCRGGLGRAGTAACMLLMDLGEASEVAISRVRAARPGAVETAIQEHFLAIYQPYSG